MGGEGGEHEVGVAWEAEGMCGLAMCSQRGDQMFVSYTTWEVIMRQSWVMITLLQVWDGVDTSWLCQGGQPQPELPRLLPQGGLPPGQWGQWPGWAMPSVDTFLHSLTFLGGLRNDRWLRDQRWEDAVFMSSLIHLWWTAIYTFVLFQDSWLQQRTRTRMKTQQSLGMCKLHRR